MNRHPFRWTGLAFGALFLSVAGNWAVWRGELLTGRQMGYVASGVLIAAGLLGILATFRQPKSSPPSTFDQFTDIPAQETSRDDPAEDTTTLEENP